MATNHIKLSKKCIVTKYLDPTFQNRHNPCDFQPLFFFIFLQFPQKVYMIQRFTIPHFKDLIISI